MWYNSGPTTKEAIVQIELDEQDMMLVSMMQTAGDRLSEYQMAHPEADEQDMLYYAKRDTVRFFQTELAQRILRKVIDINVVEQHE